MVKKGDKGEIKNNKRGRRGERECVCVHVCVCVCVRERERERERERDGGGGGRGEVGRAREIEEREGREGVWGERERSITSFSSCSS